MSEPWRAHRIRKVMHMQRLNRADKHLEQCIEVEHYRLHCAERWPESDYKEAVLAAIHSTLKTLEATPLARRLNSPAAWFAHPCKLRQWFWNCLRDHKAPPRSRGWRREGRLPCELQRAAHRNFAGFAWIVLALNVDFKWTLSDCRGGRALAVRTHRRPWETREFSSCSTRE